jgi:hypothetical protein
VEVVVAYFKTDIAAIPVGTVSQGQIYESLAGVEI